MKKSFVVVMLTLVVGLMLVSSVAAAGYRDGFSNPDPGIVPGVGRHAPECKSDMDGKTFVVSCVDSGGDIVSAGVKFAGKPPVYSVKWDGSQALILVSMDSVSGPATWYVSDAAGSTTGGSISQ